MTWATSEPLRRLLDELTARSDNREALQVERYADTVDQHQASRTREEAAREAEKLQTRIRAVRHAISRADAGEYGVCEDCDGPIAAARLAVIPEAVTCINCQSRREYRRRTA